MFLKRTLLACSLALIFPALPSYAEVGTESGNTAQAENRVYGSVLPITWRRHGTTRLTTISISRPSRHNRWTYDDEKIDKYNERPWGRLRYLPLRQRR